MPLFSRRRGKPETAAPRPPEFHSAGAALLPSAKALIAAPLSFIECGLGGAVAAFDGEGEAVILDAAGASLLQALKRPCAPGELEDRLREQGWDGDDFEKAQAAIEGFEKGGLLRRLDGMIEEARSAPPALSGGVSAGPGLGLLAIPTRDRPATLERALAAWLSAVAGNENDSLPPDLMVVDDSLVDALATAVWP